jgi:hypothetical protein
MRNCLVFLGLSAIVSTPGLADGVLSNLLSCHEGLMPYFNGEHAHHRYGRNAYDIDYWSEVQDGRHPFQDAGYRPAERARMIREAQQKQRDYGRPNLIVSGTRGGKKGIYVLEQTPTAHKLTFYPLPDPETNKDSVEISTGSDAAEGSTKADEYEFRTYDLALPIGGSVRKLQVAGRFSGHDSNRPMYLTCQWDCADWRTYARPRGENVSLTDKDAEKVFVDTLVTELSNPDEGFRVSGGFGHLNPEQAVANCLRNFPATSRLGQVINLRKRSLVYMVLRSGGTTHNTNLSSSSGSATPPVRHAGN